MHTKDYDRVASHRKLRMTAFLLGVAGALATLPTASMSAAPKSGHVITVVGSGQPAQDVAAINEAIAQAEPGDVIRLSGHFELGDDCDNCVLIDKAVTLEGTGDPTEPEPVESLTTIIEGGTGPFLVALNSDTVEAALQGLPTLVRIANIWFRKTTLMAIALAKTQGSIQIERNRITDITPAPLSDALPSDLFRFGLAAAVENPEDLSGALSLTGNHIDLFHGPEFPFGDDNAFGIARCNFSALTVTENFLETRGEAELEGCANPDAEVIYARNEIIMHANDSPVGLLVPEGGHPAAIKIHDNDASRVEVRDNDITTLGNVQGVCMLASSRPGAKTVITGNTCQMEGQAAALLAGFVGNPGFFGPSALYDAHVYANTFRGRARRGIAFLDLTFPGEGQSLINDGHGNHFNNNDLSGLTTTVSSLEFGPHTHDNTFAGRPSGTVIDQGTDNRIAP
ncbi:MAG: hypothetical protein ACRERE_39715 [Candidatus Entotheonellia bacterium]